MPKFRADEGPAARAPDKFSLFLGKNRDRIIEKTLKPKKGWHISPKWYNITVEGERTQDEKIQKALTAKCERKRFYYDLSWIS